MTQLTHFDDQGSARMVNVAAKPATLRSATASAQVVMKRETMDLIRNQEIQKGDVLEMARIAAIMGSKKVPDLIPLCHPVRLDGVEIEFEFISASELKVWAITTATDRTGVEMEALTAVAAACLTIYDMCKSVDRLMEINHLQLEKKSGGKSGEFVRSE